MRRQREFRRGGGSSNGGGRGGRVAHFGTNGRVSMLRVRRRMFVVVVVMHVGAALTRGPLHVMYGLENSLEAAAHFMRVMRLVRGSVRRRR